MKKLFCLTLLGLMTSIALLAQPTKGKYYRITNANYGSVMTENWGNSTVTCTGKDLSAYNQVWEYTTKGALKNVYTGKYIQNQTGTSQTFTTGTTSVTVSFTNQADGHYGINISGNQMHCDAARNVVRWNDNANESNHWTITEVTLTEEEANAAHEEYIKFTDFKSNASKYGKALETFYTDLLCTELKPEYAAMSDDALTAAMAGAGLPAELQQVAVKIKNQWWNDTNKSDYADANKYAKDFRIATYKPYSDANNWRDKMNTYAPSFMGNPTGIYAKNKDIIHVFVGNDIPSGATLYLTPIRNHGRIGSRTEGTQLKKGYNAIITTTDSVVYYINYVVNTIPTENVNAHTKTIAKISDFPDLDIHIEGGQCVGYYQKPAVNSPEEDEKYQYLIENANDGMYFMVKGATSLFYFKKYTYEKHFAETIWNSINWFDRLHFWEFALIGVMDDVANGKCENGTEYSKAAYPLNMKGGDAFYPTYCNNPTMAMEGPNGQNPHATTFYTSYPGPGSCESSFNAERADFDNWCAGHEHGHQIQAPYNLESCSESSVNLPSNIITYLTGYRLGRGWNFAQNYAYVADNVVFGHRDISITMRMYYNLFLYYHIGGKKKDFYPNFVKSLREDPMNFSADKWINGVGHHRATKTWIHMYKKACEAAQEDLTEYFRMWGFFVPCKEVHFGDYTNYYVSLTQKEIDDAIAEVKAKGYPENLQIMFVEDRQIPRERTDIWAHTATGTQKYKPTNWGTWYTEAQLKAEYGDVGDILTYIDGSANTSEYTYILSGNKLSLTGKGGVGFIVYDAEGNNKYMSNRLNFEIPTELAAQDFTIKVINADGTSSIVENGANTASDEEKLEILRAAIEESKKFTSLEDATYKKVGYYSTEDIAPLKAYVADANTAIKNGDVDNYLPLAKSINDYTLLLQAEKRMKQIVPNATYSIKSKRTSTKYLNSTSAFAINTSTSSSTGDYRRWAFMPIEGKEDVFYMMNKKNHMMAVVVGEKEKITGVKTTDTIPDRACTVKVENLGGGVLGIRPNDATYINLDPYGGIALWGDPDEGSQWYITEDETVDILTDEEINELITMSEDLLEDVSVYTETQTKVELQITDQASAGYLSTNAKSTNETSYPFSEAIDGNEASSSRFQMNSNSTDETPYLKVDLGSGKTSNLVQFYMKGGSTYGYATSAEVYASNNGTSWTKVAEIDNMTYTFTSDLIKTSAKYRYWRIDLTSSNKTDQKQIGIYEFEFYTVTTSSVLKEEFAVSGGVSSSYVTSCRNAIQTMKDVLEADYRTIIGDYVAYQNLLKYYNYVYDKAVKIDPTVDINDIEGTENGESNSIFDLSGRRVSNANKGVFIVNGKKVIR